MNLDPFPWQCIKNNGTYVGNNPNPSAEFSEWHPRIGFEQDRSKYPKWEGWDEPASSADADSGGASVV